MQLYYHSGLSNFFTPELITNGLLRLTPDLTEFRSSYTHWIKCIWEQFLQIVDINEGGNYFCMLFSSLASQEQIHLRQWLLLTWLTVCTQVTTDTSRTPSAIAPLLMEEGLQQISSQSWTVLIEWGEWRPLVQPCWTPIQCTQRAIFLLSFDWQHLLSQVESPPWLFQLPLILLTSGSSD